MVKDAAFRFKDAMDRAMRILKGRRFCQRMIDDGPRSMLTAPTATATPQNDESMAERQRLVEQNKYVEIYIDESFKQGARVGGLVAAYPDAAAASAFTKALHAQCPKIVWGFDEEKIQSLTSLPLDKRPASDIVRATLDQIESLANTTGIVLSAFLLEASQEQVALAQKTSAPSDFIYRELLRNTIECFLYLWPKARQVGTTIGIHAATRVDKSLDDPLDPTWAKGWQEKFGCKRTVMRRMSGVLPHSHTLMFVQSSKVCVA